MKRRVLHLNSDGTVLIIVLWVAFGLVALALYFAHSMSMEMRASDNRVAGIEAEQAILGATRYVSNLLATAQETNTLPDTLLYHAEAVPVGAATFWLIGRGDDQISPDRAVYSLVDEGSKLNLNASWLTPELLENLPRMTPELAAAIVDWRDTDSEVTENGAEDETYQRLNPPYRCKNAPFESVEELRLVFGADPEILYGEDMNRNGVLDGNENDGDLTLPTDNRDGRLDPGIVEYFTVSTSQPAAGTNVNNQTQLAALLEATFGIDRANAILSNVGPRTNFSGLLEFYMVSGMTEDEFVQVEGNLRAGTNTVGLINPNTASEEVLACVPGIGWEVAPTVIAARQSRSQQWPTIAWLADALEETNAIAAAPYLTSRSYQIAADIAALGHHGRGYQRWRIVFDTSDGTPRILARQDLTQWGWALDEYTHDTLLLVNRSR